MNTLSDYIDIILESLEKKLALLDEIIRLNAEQKEIFQAAELDLESLEQNMQEKSDCVEELTRLDDGFVSVYERVREQLPQDRDVYKAQISAMQDCIRRITDKSMTIQSDEARNKVLAEQKFAEGKREVGNGRRSSTMANNYYKSMSKIDTEPQLFDRQN